MPRIIIDNGAHTIKAAVQNSGPPRIIPNAVIRSKGDKTTYFGHEFERCKDYSSLHYRLPFEKGYIVDWDAQKAVWDGLFSTEVLNVDTTESSLLITEPYFNLPNIQDFYDQFIFEEYEFQSYYRCTPASLIPHGTLFKVADQPAPECCVVIDSGFSFTHVVPMINGKVVWNAVKRVDVGGKLLTNHLKELVSYRQWNMMDETFIVNDVKEQCCYVSQNFGLDLDICRGNTLGNSIIQEYILPDLSKNQKGRIRTPEDKRLVSDQVLIMNNERFVVPEIIFRPGDIGLEQMGLSHTVAHCISLLPTDLQGMFWANIGLIGGNTKFRGFRERLMQELRTLAPVDCGVAIYECNDPILEPYESALSFDSSSFEVTRSDYQEMGGDAIRRKFKPTNWRNFTGISVDTNPVNGDETSEPERKSNAPAKVKPNPTSGRSTRSTRARTISTKEGTSKRR